jgi:hypothetical protein
LCRSVFGHRGSWIHLYRFGSSGGNVDRFGWRCWDRFSRGCGWSSGIGDERVKAVDDFDVAEEQGRQGRGWSGVFDGVDEGVGGGYDAVERSCQGQRDMVGKPFDCVCRALGSCRDAPAAVAAIVVEGGAEVPSVCAVGFEGAPVGRFVVD